METQSRLAHARAERGLTLAKVAEYASVDPATVCRWEKGTMRPYPRHVVKLCQLYGKTAEELGLTQIKEEEAEEAQLSFVSAVRLKEDHAFVRYYQREIELRFQYILFDWLHSKKPSTSCAMLQYRLSRELEDYDSMMNEQHPKRNTEGVDVTRREALRHMALFPIRLLSLDAALGATPKWAPEDILPHCAAGITACHHLAKGQYDDMNLAYSVISTYLSPLKEIVEQSSSHRKEAARLVAQALVIKAKLSIHREGPKRAINYGKQAEIFSKEGEDPSLQLIVLKQLAWYYSSDKQSKQALRTALQAQHMLAQSEFPIPPIIQSSIYEALGKYQAQNGRREEALAALHTAYDLFPSDEDERGKQAISPEAEDGSSFSDFNRSNLILGDGLAQYYLGHYNDAFSALSKAINPETLMSKVPTSSVRTRLEIINHQALTSLKSPKRDMDLTISLWQAGMQGATTLRSELRFDEALTAYHMMEALWPGEARIKELRDLIEHW